MRVLCTGDVHLGRPISQIPEDTDVSGLTATDGWRAIVDLAIDEQVDLVAISGDLIDEANRYYEATGPVENGVRRLADAGIPVVAVAGNHDFSALPRLAESLDGALILLGRNQQWERWTLVQHDLPVLHVDGWSFSHRHVADNPLDQYQLPSASDAPVLGLLHADLEQPRSHYAPVTLARLQQQRVTAWLLGHVHAAALYEADGVPPVLYPGSPYALDPGESGIHGVWIATFTPGYPPRFESYPLAKVRYQPHQVDISGAATADEAIRLIERSVRDTLENAVNADDSALLRLLLVRLTITGAIPPDWSLDAELSRMQQELRRSVDRATVAIEKLVDATTAAIDLEAVSAGIDAPAVVARLIRSLRSGTPDRALLTAAQQRSDDLAELSSYQQMAGNRRLDEAQLAAMMEREAWRLLRTLLAQKHGDA